MDGEKLYPVPEYNVKTVLSKFMFIFNAVCSMLRCVVTDVISKLVSVKLHVTQLTE